MVVPCYCCYLWTICLYLSIITTWHTSIGIIVQYNHHKISYKPRPSHAAPRSMSLFDRLSESHSQRHRLQTQSTRLYRKSVSQEFMDNVFSDKNKPIINPIRNPYVNTSPKFQPMMNEGGQLTSLELYATAPALQSFVVSQIANWIRGESLKVLPHGSYSVIFASLDGQRLVHAVGWKAGLNEQATEHSFNEFRKRASLAADGLPLDLKESTHIFKPVYSIPEGVQTLFDLASYDKYPLFALDFFTVRLSDDSAKAKTALKKAVTALDGNVPEMISMHMLSSTDKIVQCLMSTWTAVDGKESLCTIDEYAKQISEVKKYAIEGTMTDIIEKTNPSKRLYHVADIHIP